MYKYTDAKNDGDIDGSGNCWILTAHGEEARRSNRRLVSKHIDSDSSGDMLKKVYACVCEKEYKVMAVWCNIWLYYKRAEGHDFVTPTMKIPQNYWALLFEKF